MTKTRKREIAEGSGRIMYGTIGALIGYGIIKASPSILGYLVGGVILTGSTTTIVYGCVDTIIPTTPEEEVAT